MMFRPVFHRPKACRYLGIAAACLLLMSSGCGGGSTAGTTGVAEATPAVVLNVTRFSATTALLPNPERGFYGGSGDDFVSAFDVGSVRAAYSAGQRLVLARVPLAAYRTTDLPTPWLANLNASFAQMRTEGMKVTLLFSYDFSATGRDATAVQIKRHLGACRA